MKNPRIIADEVSRKSGFDVYVPDILNGDAIPSSFMKVMPEVAGEKMSIGTRVSDRYLGACKNLFAFYNIAQLRRKNGDIIRTMDSAPPPSYHTSHCRKVLQSKSRYPWFSSA